MSVTPAVCIATSVPVLIAKPTSAAASAGASFTPSPTIATTWPAARNRSTSAALSPGSTSARTSVMPSSPATASAVAPVVSGEHHRLNTHVREPCDRRGSAGARRIGDTCPARQLAVDGHEHHRARLLQVLDGARVCGQIVAQLLHPAGTAHLDPRPAHCRLDAPAGHRLEVVHLGELQPTRFCGVQQSSGEGVLRALLGSSRPTPARALPPHPAPVNTDSRGRTLRQRARLVEDDHIDGPRPAPGPRHP